MTGFVKILMSGEIENYLYATYFRDTPNLLRAEHIHYDYRIMDRYIGAPPEITQSTKEYIEHIESIQDEAMKLYAHIYVRHMGDLSGGQMIMRKKHLVLIDIIDLKINKLVNIGEL